MPVESLQDMRDFVDHHVSQDYRWRRRAGRLLYAVPEHGDVNSFEGAGDGQRAGQEASRCLWSDPDGDRSLGNLPAVWSLAVPFDPYPGTGKHPYGSRFG
jgi:hypothetical protein